jgi:hypothetical protein
VIAAKSAFSATSTLNWRQQANARVEILLRAIPVMEAAWTSAFACRRRLTTERIGLVDAGGSFPGLDERLGDNALSGAAQDIRAQKHTRQGRHSWDFAALELVDLSVH